MYEDRYEPYPRPYAVPDPDDDHRLRHLVLVDGRVVDTWTERVEGTPWQVHADRFDRDVLISSTRIRLARLKTQALTAQAQATGA